jgi:plasmid stabilization system protein ParE
MFQVIVSPRAEKEIRSSWDWYEDRQQGLGDRFASEVISKLRKIQQNPEVYSRKTRSYREAKIDSFPIVVVYRLNRKKEVVYILSVFHTSRDTRGKY